MADNRSLTICTVSFGHARELALNWQLATAINQGFREKVSWLVAENAPEDAADRTCADDPHFHIRRGSQNTSLGASHHHADAMNALLSDAHSRFVLILDPDFYLLYPEWLTKIPAHMRQRNLAFFGAPWHPRYTENYRYFPAVHCMFIDKARVPLHEIDFRPALNEDKDTVTGPRTNDAMSLLFSGLRRLSLMKHRLRRPRDTGSRIFERFGSDPRIKVECVTPVFRAPWEELSPRTVTQIKCRLVESVLPDRLCYIPKRLSSYTRNGFRERNWISAELPNRWEEHIWNNLPFGMHLRKSYSSGTRDQEAEFSLCRNVLSDYIKGNEHSV